MQKPDRRRYGVVRAALALMLGVSAVAGVEAPANAKPTPPTVSIGGGGMDAKAAPRAASAPCFPPDGAAVCTSTDPNVTIYTYNHGNTSACTFTLHVVWGDKAEGDYTISGGADGTHEFLAEHLYANTGTYKINAQFTHVTGGCGTSGGLLTFTYQLGDRLLDSPPADSVIAMTDQHYLPEQPAGNQVTPVHRHLRVGGLCSCNGKDVTLSWNGGSLQERVASGRWSGLIPNVHPGVYTVTAKDPKGHTETISITLIDLQVGTGTDPMKVFDDFQKMKLVPGDAKTPPSMPDLHATVRVAAQPQEMQLAGTTFAWQLTMINRYSVKTSVKALKANFADGRTPFSGNSTGTAQTWTPTTSEVVGGWGRLTTSAQLPGVLDDPVVSEPHWFDLKGANPDKDQAVKPFINAHAQQLPNAPGLNVADAVTHIACVESQHHYYQFSPTPEALSLTYQGTPRTVPATSTLIPKGLDNPAAGRPNFGWPSGIGIMQLDPADFPSEQWNWQTNITGGISRYTEDVNGSLHAPKNAADRINAPLKKMLQQVNARRAKAGLGAIHTAPVQAPPVFTAQQLHDDSIRRYNGGVQYKIDAHFVVTRNGLDIQLVNAKGHVLTGPLQWTDAHPVNPKDPFKDYVYAVNHCTE